jgi:GH35 family endo-1,4-beta-xylanase
MGVLKFQVATPDLASRLPELRKAYVTGLDRTPSRLGIEFRHGLMICHRDSNESGRLFVPWPVEGFGTPIVGTATLSERPEPYSLAVELARGRLNELRNQLADWKQMGLRVPPEFDGMMAQAHRAFVKAATAGEQPEEAHAAAQASLAAAYSASTLMVEVYTTQVLQTRLASTPKLPTSFGCMLDGDPKLVPWSKEWGATFNAAQVCSPWRTLAPAEGQYHWEPLDAQVAWCRRHKLPFQAGPLLDFRARALPDWIWLWEGDFDTLNGLIVDFVRQAVTRYRGKVPLWHLVHRPACGDFLGLSEEEQIRIAARAIQVARQADPSAQFTIGVERPWAEWMASTTFQLGPLHLADYLVRADLGLAGVVLEIAPGYSSPGSHIRDLFDFSRLLDLFALLNLPLHIWLAFPSSAQPDPQADPTVRVEAGQWPGPPDEMSQAEWAAKWAALAVAKPFVRSVTWLQASDATPHLYPHAGLFRADQTPKPLFSWIKSFRREILA